LLELPALPADAQTVALFIASEADAGNAVSTLEHRLAAIRLIHLGKGFASPHNTQAVVEVMRGIRNSRKEEGELPNRKAPALDTIVIRMVNALNFETVRGLRDRALLLYGFAGALRRSELVGINVAHIEAHERGHLLTIPYSKGDQTGAGQTIGILAQPDSPYCPVASLEASLNAARIKNGSVFRRMYRGDAVSDKRLGDRAVAELIKDRVYQLKDPTLHYQQFSGHSLRSGFLTSASRQKADVFKLIAQSRHKQLNTLMDYVKDQELFESHAAENLLQAQVPEIEALKRTFGRWSSWLIGHDQAAADNEPVPDPDELWDDLQALDDFVKRVNNCR